MVWRDSSSACSVSSSFAVGHADRGIPCTLSSRDGSQARWEIAGALFISVNTVAVHIARILAKTDASNRTEAAAISAASAAVSKFADPGKKSSTRRRIGRTIEADMDEAVSQRLFRAAGAERWGVPPAFFAEALERSLAKAFADRPPSAAERDRYLASLHVSDLALACGCAVNHDAAWDHFVTEFRPALYRAADAVAPDGGAREVADALIADLYGVKESGDARPSLFRYFHGRSSLATWLRALVSQRYVDHIRARRRLAPLPDEASPAVLPAPAVPADPDRPRFAAAFADALGRAIAALAPRDRLRLACYYAQEMTLATIGRLTGEHEATVSRHLARTRRGVREAVEQRLRVDYGFGDREIAECFASVAADTGTLDLGDWLGSEDAGKDPRGDRSTSEGVS